MGDGSVAMRSIYGWARNSRDRWRESNVKRIMKKQLLQGGREIEEFVHNSSFLYGNSWTLYLTEKKIREEVRIIYHGRRTNATVPMPNGCEHKQRTKTRRAKT